MPTGNETPRPRVLDPSSAGAMKDDLIRAVWTAMRPHVTLDGPTDAGDLRLAEVIAAAVQAEVVAALRERAQAWKSSDLMDAAAWIEGTL